jgi:hypothetical protein
MLTATCGLRRSLFLYGESELPTLFGPGERHGTEEPLEGQYAGFYAPAQLVRDAREHGVEVCPVDLNRSEWDCTLECRDEEIS